VIKTKRAYDEPGPEDGTRFLVDRIWPQGVKKQDLQKWRYNHGNKSLETVGKI
jgi:uncharacterized protein YeaO (DUF488 family)